MKIAALISKVPGSRLPIVFNGKEPKLIGDLPTYAVGSKVSDAIRDRVDAMLISAGLSATFISLGVLNGRRLVVAHG